MRTPTAFVMWCRWGTMPLEARGLENACHEALDYAARHGLFVVVYEAGEGGREVAACPPSLQADAVPGLLFGGGTWACLIPARLN